MSNSRIGFILLLSFIFLSACKKEDKFVDTAPEINRFIWNGLNSWYYWQELQPALDDAKKNDRESWNNSISGDAVNLFNSLLYRRNEVDRFSWIVDDYEELNQQFAGISRSFGYEFGLTLASDFAEDLDFTPNNGDALLFVQYVIPNTPASRAGIQRGDLVYGIDNQVLTANNFRTLLFGSNSYTLNFLERNNDGLLSRSEKSIALNAEVITEDPVHVANVINLNNHRIGYLNYNSFRHTYHEELYDAFQLFQNQNITDLVLDLRYNPGGSVLTALYLGSLIHNPGNSDVFVKLDYNSKHNGRDVILNFTNQMEYLDADFNSIGQQNFESLNLSRLYVLTSTSTASASELIINSLSPYIEITQIGETTSGKNVGSITLYDSDEDFTNREGANPSHKWAMQPIVSQVQNSLGFSDYSEGFDPDIMAQEIQHLTTMKPLGDPEEYLFNLAIQQICPECFDDLPALNRSSEIKSMITNSIDQTPHRSELILNGIQ